jgi:outer membrane receptor protein involved in Fe transport
VTGIPEIVVPNGSAGPSSMKFQITGTPYTNSNWNNTVALRGALKLAITDDFSATLSTSYQNQYIHDGTGSFWSAASNPKGGDFATPIYFAGSPATNPNLEAMDGLPLIEEGRSKFILPSLNLTYSNGTISVTSISSYFDRKSYQYTDFTRGYGRSYSGIEFPRPGDRGFGIYRDYQKNWTEEVRVQSVDDSPFQWLAGVFYTKMRQSSNQDDDVNFLAKSTLFGTPANGPPFGPGTSSLINYFGAPTGPNSNVYNVLSIVNDRQIAGFGEASYRLFDRLKVTVGARYGSNKTRFLSYYGGPENVLNAPSGLACIPNSNPCIPVAVGQYKPGQGPFAPQWAVGNVPGKENVLTPKFNVAYNVTPDDMIYATVSKGYRQGGGQIRVPGVCNDQLKLLGYTDAQGNPTQPLSFGSDSVWNYEVGTKSKLFDDRVYVDGSAYYIKWKGIQQRVGIPICGYAFVDNIVSATSKGFDLALSVKPIDSITAGTAIGYNKPTIDTTIPSPIGGLPLFYKGQYITSSGAPWTVHLYGQYDFRISDDRSAFARVDYTYNSSLYPTGGRDPNVRGYISPLGRVPETHLVNARVGSTISDVEVSLFVNNLFNAAPDLNLTHGRNDELWTDTTFQPRTIGLTASYRY